MIRCYPNERARSGPIQQTPAIEPPDDQKNPRPVPRIHRRFAQRRRLLPSKPKPAANKRTSPTHMRGCLRCMRRRLPRMSRSAPEMHRRLTPMRATSPEMRALPSLMRSAHSRMFHSVSTMRVRCRCSAQLFHRHIDPRRRRAHRAHESTHR